jgi:hypothetical protein
MTPDTDPVWRLTRRAARPSRVALAAVACTIALAGQAVAGGTAALAATSPWAVQQSPPLDTVTPNAQFSDVSCPTRTSCIAVGEHIGTDGVQRTLAERWDGQAWHVVASPSIANVQVNSLTSVSCVSATACEAVGFSSKQEFGTPSLLAESWNGTTWRMVPIQKPGGTHSEQISCATATACMLVSTRTTTASDGEQAVTERWNGQRWSIVAARQPAAFTSLSGVSCPGPRNCTAVGGRSATHFGADTVLVEHWNGVRWSVETVQGPHNAFLTSVSCPTTSACTAVGGSLPDGENYRLLVEDSRMGRWTASTPVPASAQILSPLFSKVSCSAPRVCTALVRYLDPSGDSTFTTGSRGATGGFRVGLPNMDNSSNDLSGVSCRPVACEVVGSLDSTDGRGDQSDEGSILAERGTGSSLVVQVTPNPVSTAGGSLSTLSCVTSGFCAATAAPDTTPAPPLPLADVRQDNHWTASPPQEGVLQDVSCTSASFCLALAIGADAERWNGTGWSEVSAPDHYFPSQATGLASISCTSATSCVAVGSTGSGENNVPLAASWDGITWTTVAPPNPAGSRVSRLSAVSCTSATDCVAIGDSFQTAHPNIARALIETLHGTKWTLASPNFTVTAFQPTSVSCASASACMAIWASFGGKSQAEWWNGTTWRATTIVGSTRRADGTVLNGVSCTSATACTAVGSFSSASTGGLLVENWNGTVWSITPSPNPTAGFGEFNAVSCTSATVCTAVGSTDRTFIVPLVEARG